MQPRILEGKICADKTLDELKHKILPKPPDHRPPGLAVIQVGSNPASSSYIKGKKTSAQKHGLYFEHIQLPSSTNRAQLESQIDLIAAKANIDGFILQLPLDLEADSDLANPDFIHKLLSRIPAEKDADGLHPENQGKLYANESSASNWTAPLPATALGIIRLLQFNGYTLSGKNICVLGKSRLVGMPTAGLCLNEGATVTVCHSKTNHLAKYTKEADIIIVATGKKHLLTKEHIRDNQTQVVIDVGIHADPTTGKLTGDVNPETYPYLAAYSPVPGGVGPMTVAMLIENTWRLALGSSRK